MNKKLIILIILVIVIIGIGVVCVMNLDSDNNESNVNNNINDNKENNNQVSNDKVAIIYFSATGRTKKVAKYINDITNGDLIEIEPKDKYTSSDLNYSNNDCRANREQNDSNSRPEIKNNINIDSYNVIYLGYPIWWGDAPRIILTFLDNYDLSGKTVIPFCTSGSSGIDFSVRYFKNNYKNINWLDGKRLDTSKNDVTNWVNGLNY